MCFQTAHFQSFYLLKKLKLWRLALLKGKITFHCCQPHYPHSHCCSNSPNLPYLSRSLCLELVFDNCSPFAPAQHFVRKLSRNPRGKNSRILISKVSLKELRTSAMTFHPLFFCALGLRSADFPKKSGWNVMADVIGSFNFTLTSIIFKINNLIFL